MPVTAFNSFIVVVFGLVSMIEKSLLLKDCLLFWTKTLWRHRSQIRKTVNSRDENKVPSHSLKGSPKALTQCSDHSCKLISCHSRHQLFRDSSVSGPTFRLSVSVSLEYLGHILLVTHCFVFSYLSLACVYSLLWWSCPSILKNVLREVY